MVEVTGKQQQEIERLRRIIAWCRPRLKLAAYRETLDRYLDTPQPVDHTLIVQSAESRRQAGAPAGREVGDG